MKRVVVSSAPMAVAGAELYVDAFGHFASAYGGGHGEYMLVRADGYVGWLGPNRTCRISMNTWRDSCRKRALRNRDHARI
jgi:hypothetical protein